jgi:FixJ family two-component response regulator
MAQGTVYLVDDDATVRESLAILLRHEDIHVKTFEAASDLLDDPCDDMPACLVLDMLLPGMQGDELQQRLRERGSTLPVIFLSGQARITTVAATMRRGAFDFLEKPASTERLARVIRSAFQAHEQASRRRQEIEAVLMRHSALSRRERQILRCVVEAESSKQIGLRLHISERTVANHRRNIARKMGAHNTADLVRMAMLIEAASWTLSPPLACEPLPIAS